MNRKSKKGWLFALVYGAALVGYTGYVMLDTFVIPTVSDSSAGEINYSLFDDIEQRPLDTSSSQADESSTADSSEASSKASVRSSGKSRKRSSQEINTAPGSSSAAEYYSAETAASSDTYTDENISITLTEYTVHNTKCYVADIKLTSAQYLKTALAKNSYGKNVTDKTSSMAADNGAILAINGDYYGAREKGYVIRNGVLYRDTGTADTDVLCIYADGHFEITDSGEKTAQQLIDEGVWQAFSFGPALIEDGEISVTSSDEVGRAMASNPRTAIGIVDDLHYLFVVCDGRTSESEGLSLRELAEFMQSLGASAAYNLDGGGSSTMYWQGRVVNNPTTTGSSSKERSVSDIVYIG
ncbi:MAG: phosphodiester glycosidase family protein [Ruminococcus sp.]|nr:phosphodiester glycosidase family protein [Ruminococcus sp.]